MLVRELKNILANPKMQNNKLNVKLLGPGGDGKVTIKDVLLEMRQGFAQINSRIDQVEANLNARIDQVEANLNARIDKLVAKNNLVE